MDVTQPEPQMRVETLVTASEAYPRLEALFLAAHTAIDMGFRLFDPRTHLRSDAAQAVGETWADLFLHTINRGVTINLTVSDFDPVMAPDMHAQAWKFVEICEGVNAASKAGAAQLNIRCLLHPAQGGLAPRLMFAFRTRRELRRIVAAANQSDDPTARIKSLPGVAEHVLLREGKVQMRPLALPYLSPVTLHHKLATFDGKFTYIGGLDLNERRYDDGAHDQAAQQTWHDVQLVVTDPGVACDARAYLQNLAAMIHGALPVPPSRGVFTTTLSKKRARNMFTLAPKTISRGLLQAHLEHISRATDLIYLETQYFRDYRIAAALAAAARRSQTLRVLLLLPAAPDDVAFDDHIGLDAKYGEYLQARAIRKVRRAFGPRFLVVSPAQPRSTDNRDKLTDRSTLASAPIVYVHAKVSVFDDSAAIVSSANLNGRSMKWDAEAGVVLTRADIVRDLRKSVFDHWFVHPQPAETYAAKSAFKAWHTLALKNAACAPNERSGFILPHDVRPSAHIGVALPGAPEDLV